MRYFALFLMFLSLGMFSVGCGEGKKTTPKKDTTTETGGTGTEEKGGTQEKGGTEEKGKGAETTPEPTP